MFFNSTQSWWNDDYASEIGKQINDLCDRSHIMWNAVSCLDDKWMFGKKQVYSLQAHYLCLDLTFENWKNDFVTPHRVPMGTYMPNLSSLGLLDWLEYAVRYFDLTTKSPPYMQSFIEVTAKETSKNPLRIGLNKVFSRSLTQGWELRPQTFVITLYKTTCWSWTSFGVNTEIQAKTFLMC